MPMNPEDAISAPGWLCVQYRHMSLTLGESWFWALTVRIGGTRWASTYAHNCNQPCTWFQFMDQARFMSPWTQASLNQEQRCSMCFLYSRTPLCLKIPLSNRVWDTGEYLDPSFIATGEYLIALYTGEYLVPNNKWEREQVKKCSF